MATKRKKPDEGGFVERLAGRGEEAVTRLLDELARNPRVTDALGRAMSAKGKVDAGARRTLSQVGLAAADELKDLRKQIERLEKRLAKLEGAAKPKPGTRTAASKATTRSRAKKAPADTPSPATGRAVGGGTGRGSGSGGTAAS
jgi:polyhydroxyalkanoate synthesis regulator phasin